MPRTLILQAAGDQPTLDIDVDKIPTFSGTAYSGGVMYPRGAPNGCVLDLAGLTIPGQTLPSVREHDPKLVIGNTTTIINDRKTLACSGLLTGTDETVLTTARRAKTAGSHFPWQLSVDVELNTSDVQNLRSGQTAIVNGQRITGPMPIVRRAVLRRIDFVTKGGDRHATVAIQAAGGESAMDFAQWLGFDPASLTEEQRKALQAKYDAEMADPEDVESGLTASSSRRSLTDFDAETESLVQKRRQTLAAESARQTGITQVCDDYNKPSFEVQGRKITLEAHAIAEGWSVEQTELHALRESRPKAPAGRVVNLEASGDVLTAALLMSIGRDLEKPLPQRMRIQAQGGLPAWLFDDINSDRKQMILQAAHGLQHLSSMGFAERAAQSSGFQQYGGGVMATLEAASSSSFGNVISTTAFVAVLQSFESVADTTQGWVEEDPTCVNFLPTKQVGLKAMGGTMPILPPGGTAEEAYLSDKGEVFKVNRHAKKMTVDEQTMINDQLGEIMKAFGQFGDMAGRVKPDLVYALLQSNPTMADSVALFHATHSNVGASDNLTSAYLKAAVAALLLAKETDGAGNIVNIGVNAKYLLLPPSIALTGDELIHSSERVGSVSADAMVNNALKDLNLQRVSDPRLENGVVNPATGAMVTGSATKWYVAGDRNPAIKVGYLKTSGKLPQVRRTTLSNGQWGVAIDAKYDIGVGAVRHQTIFRST